MKEQEFWRRLAEWSVRHARWVLAAALLAAAGACALALTRLQLRTSNLDLVDPQLPEVRRFLEFAEEFGTPNPLVIVLEGESPARLEEAVRVVGPKLRTVPGVRAVVDRNPLDRALLEKWGLDEFLRSHDRKLICIFVQPDDPWTRADQLDPMVSGVRRALEASNLDTLGVKAGLTGLPAYALDDRDTIRRDLSRLSWLSLALVLALFTFGFHAIRRPILATVSMVVSVVWTMGVTAVYPGHLTLLSAFFASILFGLGIDYGIHVVSRVEEERARGLPERDAIPRAIESLGRSLTTGALTTAVVFLSLAASGFRGFAELGFIAGSGVLLCLLATFTVLPALLAVFPSRRDAPRSARAGRILLRFQSPALAAALAFAGLIGAVVAPPAFDADYLNLEPKNSEAVRLEREMVNRTDLSPQFAVFVADTRSAAAALSDRLLGEDVVGDVRSIADLDALAEGGDGGDLVPGIYRAALQSRRGRFAVYAYPQHNLWDPGEQDRFTTRMRELDPGATGMPFLGRFMVEQSKRGMRRAAGLGGILLVVCVWLDYRRWRPTAWALMPTALTVASLHGAMRLVGLRYNAINVMALPIILGVAVDYGVHLVHRARAEAGDVLAAVRGAGRGILLSAGTTLAGFGALMLTEHRGLASFAAVMSLGVALAVVNSVIVLPVALARWGKWIG